jgi:hypothetical protein
LLNEILGNIEDLAPLANFLNNLELRTYVYNPGTAFNSNTHENDPGIPAVSHRIKMSYASFNGYTQVTPTGADGPTLAHNPFIGPNPILNSPSDNTPKVKISMGSETAEGSFLFDTGAAVSMISEELAAQLNVQYKMIGDDSTKGTPDAELEIYDANSGQYVTIENQFKLTVGGVGGQTTLAGFYLDSLMLRVLGLNDEFLSDSDPRHLNFIGAPVLVHSIFLESHDPNLPDVTLDGILGMNFLVASVNVEISELGVVASGYTAGAFDWITFDEPNGILGLALKNPGDFDGDGDVDGEDFGIWQANYPKASGATLATGDADGDGDVDGADFVAWQTHFHTPVGTATSSPVPEPAAWILAACAAGGCLIGARRRR